jgi:hypothetical protein
MSANQKKENLSAPGGTDSPINQLDVVSAVSAVSASNSS